MGNYVCQQCEGCYNQGSIQYLDVVFLKDRLADSSLVQQLSLTVDRETIWNSLVEFGYYTTPHQEKGIKYDPEWGYYEGKLNQNKQPDGKGHLFLKNLSLYKGSFRFGNFHGQGSLLDNLSQNKFQGTWVKGLPQQGTLTSLIIPGRPISIREIQLRNSKMFFAEVKFPNRLIYRGEFLLKKSNFFLFEGQGKMLFPDGSSYEGKWMNGKMQGFGKYTWENGDYYQGNYHNGLKCGEGKMFWSAENKIYEGQWFQGQITPSSVISSEIESEIIESSIVQQID